MKIGESIKKSINNAFIYTVFFKKDEKSILKTLRTKAHGGNLEVIPPIPTDGFSIEIIDKTHYKMTITYDDYVVSGVITWKINENGNSVFMKYE